MAHVCRFGPIETARFTGNPHRKCVEPECRVVSLDLDDPTCEWFAKCVNPSAGTVAHPVLGSVPTCTSCAQKLDLSFEQEEPSHG